MSSSDCEDFGHDLMVAMERDLKPLLKESEEALGLGPGQLEPMEEFLSLAWFSGIRSGQAQLRAHGPGADAQDPTTAITHFEADFKALLERSADALNLTLSDTISMWSLLHQAWMAGIQTCRAELIGLYLERKTDVTEEARRWLEGEEETTP